MKIKLKRILIKEEGCSGVLVANDEIIAYTMERTYTTNEGTQHVKIPFGAHSCTKSFYNKGGYATYEIHIEGHSRILFHKGNAEIDSEGCILVGSSLGKLNGKDAVLGSAAGFANFMKVVEGYDNFLLIVE